MPKRRKPRAVTAKQAADTATRQADLFAELVAEVVLEGKPRVVVAKLEREQNVLWVTRLLGKRCPVHSLAIASHDLERIALAYGADVVWNDKYNEKPTVRGKT